MITQHFIKLNKKYRTVQVVDCPLTLTTEHRRQSNGHDDDDEGIPSRFQTIRFASSPTEASLAELAKN